MRTLLPSEPFRPGSDADEVGPAVRDMSYRLTHNLSDTPEDLRDAAALAPLVAVKLALKIAHAVTVRPRQTALAIVGLAVMLAGVAASRRKRR